MGMEINKTFLEFQQMKYNLFKSQDPKTGLFDVIFEVEGRVIYAHKNMLNLVSPTFASMLSYRWNPNKDEPIKIKGYSYDDFYQFLIFLYTAKCQLTKTNIYSMVDIAEFYGIQLFKEFCDEYLSKMEITTGNIFKLIELADKYAMSKLKASAHGWTGTFVDSDGFLNAEKQIITEIILAVKDKVKPEDLFQAVFKWAEKQAIGKQMTDPKLNLSEIIKTDFSDFHAYISFDKMELKFLHEFVVPRGFIFSSYAELSKILSDRHSIINSQTKVKITNEYGHTLYGNLIPDETVIENIKSINLSIYSEVGYYDDIWWFTKQFTIPSSPSPLKKRNGVDWYLIFDSDGWIRVFSSYLLNGSEYLLAELTAFTDDFQLTYNCKIDFK